MSIAEKLTTIAENERDIKFGIDAIEGALRDLLQTNDKMKLEDMPRKVYDVYGKGSNDGYNGGLAEGIEEGKQAEHNAFWDTFLDNGNRTEFNYAFVGSGWTVGTFKPNHNVTPTTATRMFQQFSSGTLGVSLSNLFEQAGVELDTSNCTRHDYMFYGSWVTETPNIDLTQSTNANNLYYDCVRMIKAEITIPESCPLTAYSGWVSGCKALEDLIVNGVLKYSLDLGSCTKLNRNSFGSVFTAMSTTVTGQTLTVSRIAVNAAFTEEEWSNLTATRPNWSIVYKT